MTTSQLSYAIEIDRDDLLNQLLILIMMGWIEMVAVAGEMIHPWWESELLWGLTKHSYEHTDPEPGCEACEMQARLNLHFVKGNADV